MPPGPQAAVRLCLCKGRSSEHLLVTWLRFRTPNSWFSMHFFFSCRPLTPTPTLENTSLSQLVLHLLNPNKAHSSGCEVLEKWNGRWEEVKLLATVRACVCPTWSHHSSLQSGLDQHCPSLPEKEEKTHPENLFQVPQVSGAGIEEKC